MPPDAIAQCAEGIATQHLVGARPRQLNLEMVDDPADVETFAENLVIFDHGCVAQTLNLKEEMTSGSGASRSERVERALAGLYPAIADI